MIWHRMRTLREAHGQSNETRKQIAALIRKAAEHEKAACAVLKEIIEQM